jgi:flagellar biosynthesis GTPase FlhF
MNTNQIIEVYEIFMKKFSTEDSMEIMSFIEDAKCNRYSISSDRKLKVGGIFEKVFSHSDTNTIVNYILGLKVNGVDTLAL